MSPTKLEKNDACAQIWMRKTALTIELNRYTFVLSIADID